MSNRLALVRDAFRTQLWPLPALAVVLAVGLGLVLPVLDAAVDDDIPDNVAGLLFGGGPEAARSVLETIAGSLITVTSRTFSLTVVTLQLASSQFSPRLLRTFTRDRFVHATLALFLATFAFALTVLRSDGGVRDRAVTCGVRLAAQEGSQSPGLSLCRTRRASVPEDLRQQADAEGHKPDSECACSHIDQRVQGVRRRGPLPSGGEKKFSRHEHRRGGDCQRAKCPRSPVAQQHRSAR